MWYILSLHYGSKKNWYSKQILDDNEEGTIFVFANFNNTERFCDAFWIKGIYKSFAAFLSITF